MAHQQHDLTLEQLLHHLEHVQTGSQALNADLLDSFRIVGISRLSVDDLQTLAVQLYRLLPVLREDPTPVCRLLETLLEPSPLHAILQIEPPVDFVAGLDVRAKAFNTLTLSLLEKGVADIASTRRLATTLPEIFTALLKLWLGTEDAGVAAKAGIAVYDLLKADRELDGSGLLPSPDDDASSLAADNPVWRRIFRDPDVYDVFFSTTNLARRTEACLSKGQVTIAQARLMEFLPRLAALDWNAAVKSHIPEVEKLYGIERGQGLTYYAAVSMVDVKGDVLMHRSLINFYADLLQNCENSYPGSSSASPPLKFLIGHKLHARTMNIYLKSDDPSHDPLDVTFLYPAAAQYVSTYSSSCYWHFAESPSKSDVVAHLDQILNIPPSRWQSSPPSSADLHVLSSVPRTSILPSANATSNSSPLLCVPTRPATADGLNTLAAILHGPVLEQTLPAREITKQHKLEMIAARKLYFAYTNYNRRMWAEIIAAADTVAILDVALAAINVVTAIATADWPSTESVVSARDDGGDTAMADAASPAMTGIEAILTAPALTTVLPWILRPPQQYSGLVGGRGDAEGAAHKIATAKYDCLKAVEARLVERMAGEGPAVTERRGELERVAHALRGRIREGIWGARADIGGRIATLEL